MKKYWYQKQLRIQQTVLREPDIVNYDVDGVVKYLLATNSNCFVLNAGGIVDFFRHDLLISNPNRFMGDRDIISEITKACKANDIRVVLRVDFRGIDKKHHDLHPDWFAISEDGKPVLWNWYSEPLPEDLYAPCYMGYYRNEHAFAFARELFNRYDIDGLWENGPTQMGACYCARCERAYQKELGKCIPRGGAFASEAYDEYRVWKGTKLLTHLNAFHEEIKKYGPDKAFCAEIFGLFHEHYKKTSANIYSSMGAMDFMVTPLFVAQYEPLQAPSILIKFLRSLDGVKTPVMLYGHNGADNHLRYIAGSPVEVKIWMWEAVAEGGSLWDCTFNGHHPGATHDQRNAYLASEIFGFMRKYEELLHRQTPVASVAIVYSQQSDIHFSAADRKQDRYLTHILGMEQVLRDSHVQYRFIREIDLNAESLAGIKLLILPNAAVLSMSEVGAIRSYVYEGGHILSTCETSLWDSDHKLRENYGLSDVFGCDYGMLQKDSNLWGYQKIQSRHAILAGFDDTELVANAGVTLISRKNCATVETPLTYVPKIYPQPPERSWLPTLDTDIPTAFVNVFGKGKSVYFSTPIDRNVHLNGHLDFSRLLQNSVFYLLHDFNPISSNAPCSVHISLNKVHDEEQIYLLHVINTTAAPRRPVAALISVSDLEIGVDFPGKTALESIEIIREDGSAVESAFGINSDGIPHLQLKLPKLNEYLAIKISTR